MLNHMTMVLLLNWSVRHQLPNTMYLRHHSIHKQKFSYHTILSPLTFFWRINGKHLFQCIYSAKSCFYIIRFTYQHLERRNANITLKHFLLHFGKHFDLSAFLLSSRHQFCFNVSLSINIFLCEHSSYEDTFLCCIENFFRNSIFYFNFPVLCILLFLWTAYRCTNL